MEKLPGFQAEGKITELKFELSLKIQNLPVEFNILITYWKTQGTKSPQ